MSSLRRKHSNAATQGGGDRLASFRAAQQSRNKLAGNHQVASLPVQCVSGV